MMGQMKRIDGLLREAGLPSPSETEVLEHWDDRFERGEYSADNFRENLTELLRYLHMTQAKAAELCGVEPPMISYWLNGKQLPSLSKFVRICAGLGVEPNWLLSKHEPIRKSKRKEDQ